MALFKLRVFVWFGPNLLSAGLYPLRDWWTLILWPLDRHAVSIRLPVRVQLPTPSAAVRRDDRGF